MHNKTNMTAIRRGEPSDLEEVAAIQAASPESALWNVNEYSQYEFTVAILNGRVAGFLVAREVAPDERELLNLAVSPEFRRRGIARELLTSLLESFSGAVFLEVRESNQAARNIYKSMGFKEVGRRREYYQNPLETAIVMKFHSC
ncbi:MAG TPA: ribosomal protein S18-alanine N-acetyltransferase [Bryobacteraceae bacterium]|nr:ribosomal protein S18-alanine N-acetyltransferase [Bryobacteraceae bacterium]